MDGQTHVGLQGIELFLRHDQVEYDGEDPGQEYGQEQSSSRQVHYRRPSTEQSGISVSPSCSYRDASPCLLTVPLRVKLSSGVVGLDPDVLDSLFLLGSLAFLSDLDHPLDGVYEEDGDKAAAKRRRVGGSAGGPTEVIKGASRGSHESDFQLIRAGSPAKGNKR